MNIEYVGTVRSCFKTEILLGTLSNPLKPGKSCNARDITEDGSGTTTACLCTTNLCNEGLIEDKGKDKQTKKFTKKFQQLQKENASKIPKPSKNSIEEGKKCPLGFERVDSMCYFVSAEKVGWIEARKKCEKKGSALVTLTTESVTENLVNLVIKNTRKHFNEFWTAGNDIETEGEWEWAGVRSKVPDFGWTEELYYSVEENCLIWVVELRTRGRYSDGWHGASCCNSAHYICQTSIK